MSSWRLSSHRLAFIASINDAEPSEEVVFVQVAWTGTWLKNKEERKENIFSTKCGRKL